MKRPTCDCRLAPKMFRLYVNNNSIEGRVTAIGWYCFACKRITMDFQ